VAPHCVKPVVAVIFDFDDTLAPDSTSQLLESLGVDVPKFWCDEVGPLVRSGWDPVPAYLYRMIEWSNADRFSEPLTSESIERMGQKIEFYPGVDTLFTRLQELVTGLSAEVSLEFYVVTSGLERLVAATAIAPMLTQLWGCELHYSDGGHALFPRNLVSFTDKTRYLFHIHKGLVASRAQLDPFAVNTRVPAEQIRVPFSNMIYVGDGFTDVPCFSLVAARNGIPLAVVDPRSRERWGRAWGFIEEKRAMNLCPTDFSSGSPTEMVLSMALQSVCDSIEREGQPVKT
jgi:hypothetical protein